MKFSYLDIEKLENHWLVGTNYSLKYKSQPSCQSKQSSYGISIGHRTLNDQICDPFNKLQIYDK